MIAKGRSPIMKEIEDKCIVLQLLIRHYPELLSVWKKDKDKEFRNEARVFAGGDEIVEYSVYSNLCLALDDYDNLENHFYQSMMLLVYSYFENTLHLLQGLSKVKCKPTVDSICKVNNILLTQDAMEAMAFVESSNAVRNNVAHNNSGNTEKNKRILFRISKQYDDIHYDNGVISFTGDKFILDSLENEYIVLKEMTCKME